jgi:N-acetylmuramoyl-L-alanine amidase
MAHIVVIDPGHGGKDPGAVAHGLAEKDVVLRLARMVRNELAYYDVDVRMTRDADVFVELSDRAAFANRLGAALFVSLHCNAGGGQGFESYIHPNAKAATATIQNVIHGEVMAYLRGYGITDRGRKRANLAVCRETRMPAVLLENLFIDNPRENSLLKDDSFLRGLARVIAGGIAKALGLQRKAAPPSEPTTAPKVTTAEGQKPVEVQKCTIVFGDRKLEGIIYEDRSYAPVRALAEALGLQVAWDAKTKTVILTKEGDTK